MTEAQAQLFVAMVVPFILQVLKKATWFPLLTERTQRWIKIGWSALAAAGSAVLITFSYDPSLGRLVVDGLTWANLGRGLTMFLTSLLVQEGVYQKAVKAAGQGGK